MISLIVYVKARLSPAAQEQVREAVLAVNGKVIFERDLEKVMESPTIIFGEPTVDYILRQPQLQWVQSESAGVDRLVFGPEPFPDHVLLTNASGVYGIPAAEHILGLMLHFARGFGFYFHNQRQGAWVRDVSHAHMLKGRTLVVLGLGDIGTQVVKRARAFGMRIFGVKRTPGNVDGVERVVTMDEMDEVLPLADHLVITLPLTQETKALLNRRRLGLLPKGAYLYNIGRGAVVDEEALIEALQTGHLGGAGLDVFETEPLKEGHPLWSMNNVLITPHIGADTPWNSDATAEVFIENLKRFAAGQTLQNVVDPSVGY